MNLKKLLNSILLALSFATIFITLISYFIYKYRQLPRVKGDQHMGPKLDGVYFSRFLPTKLDDTQPGVDAEVQKRNIFKFVRTNNIGVFFVVVFVVLVAAMSIESKFQLWSGASDRKASADHYLELKSKGLLQEREVNPTLANPVLSEFVSNDRWQALQNQILDLKKLKFAILQIQTNTKFNKLASERAFKEWSDFLSRHEISYRTSTIDKLTGEDDIVIFPQAKALSAEDRILISRYVNSGHSVLFTGPVGALDDSGKPNDNQLAATLLNLRFEMNSEMATSYPTIFASDRTPFWDIGAGTLAEWKPLDNSFVALAGKLSEDPSVHFSPSIFEASFQGKTRTFGESPIVRGAFIQKDKSRSVWLACDPQLIQPGTERSQINVDVALVSSLRWLGREPSVKVSDYKNGLETAVVLSVDSEDKFDGALALQKTFQKDKLPATFFVVSSLLKQNPELAKDATPEEEIASHTDDHTILENLSLATQFGHIANSVRDIEELSEKKVAGFRPPEEKFDVVTLNAALQENMAYFFGGQSLQAFYPTPIADGKMLYYSRSTIDDFNILKNKALATPQQFAQSLFEDQQRVAFLGGAQFVSFHSQVMGQEPYLTGAKIFAAKLASDSAAGLIWTTQFRDFSKWWYDRQKIQISIVPKGGEFYTLKIFNSGNEDFSHLVLNTDSFAVVNSSIISVTQKQDRTSITVSELKAQQKIELNLQVVPAVERSKPLIARLEPVAKSKLKQGKKQAAKATKNSKRSVASDKKFANSGSKKKLASKLPAKKSNKKASKNSDEE